MILLLPGVGIDDALVELVTNRMDSFSPTDERCEKISFFNKEKPKRTLFHEAEPKRLENRLQRQTSH